LVDLVGKKIGLSMDGISEEQQHGRWQVWFE
jgi:hypothetical protein